jgi:hypothetical protein
MRLEVEMDGRANDLQHETERDGRAQRGASHAAGAPCPSPLNRSAHRVHSKNAAES